MIYNACNVWFKYLVGLNGPTSEDGYSSATMLSSSQFGLLGGFSLISSELKCLFLDDMDKIWDPILISILSFSKLSKDAKGFCNSQKPENDVVLHQLGWSNHVPSRYESYTKAHLSTWITMMVSPRVFLGPNLELSCFVFFLRS